MKYRYSQTYQPPAPMIDITRIAPKTSLRVGPQLAFVDSGADGTIVPIRYLEAIRAPETIEMYLRSQWGERRHVMMYLVDIQIDVMNFARHRGGWRHDCR